MTEPYSLTSLDANSFEHMVNYLALKVLGNGITGFAAGADGGRDGYLTGEAAYPTQTERWAGTWYIQSKFHKPHLSKNPQVWLVEQVEKEIQSFIEEDSSRKLPNNWIIATNIEPSGNSRTGAYDKIKSMVQERLGDTIRVDVWGGRKILDFLLNDPGVASAYGHFLTPGNVLSAIYQNINDATANIEQIIHYLVVNQFNEQIYTKLEQAGSASDSRPKIYQLFIDLPYDCSASHEQEFILDSLVSSAANTHKTSIWGDLNEGLSDWGRNIRRSRSVTIKGGPGQGKSTIGQYFSQIQRAALILSADGPSTTPSVKQVARELKLAAENKDFWPTSPRIPINIELKDFAKWYGNHEEKSKGVLSYLAHKISIKVEQDVLPGTLKRALAQKSWFVNFDGLDEVPNDVKDFVAEEIIRFTNELIPSIDADVLILCSTRPQGYSGQFDKLDGAIITLSDLNGEIALECASALLQFGRGKEEAETAIQVLQSAMESKQVLELMTTPLQSHIMAVVVRDGGRPPEKRWQLFENFYQVMKRRESTKGFQDPRISKLLRENDQLLKAIHARLGIALHARAENSLGAETTLDKLEFRELAAQTTKMLMDDNIEPMVEALMEATTERLVLVNTPENSQSVRFDIRQLQEFFAAEFIYSGVAPDVLRERIEVIGSDEHWREVMHFLLSALIVCARTTEVTVAIETLSSADEGDDCHNVKAFKRKIASGANLALRLLNEGVLEQDKRVRQKFSKILSPLYSIDDPRAISTIVNIKHPNTLSWLVNGMIDHVLMSSETECIGAAIALSQIMPSDNSRAKEVFGRIFGFGEGFLNALFEANIRRFGYPFQEMEVELNVDFIAECLSLFLNLKKGTEINISYLLRNIRIDSGGAEKAINGLGVSDVEKELLGILVLPSEMAVEEHASEEDDNLSYCGIGIKYYAHNWLTNPYDKKLVTATCFQGESLVLRFTWLALVFISERSYDAFVRLVQQLDPDFNFLETLPRHIRALLPIDLLLEHSGESYKKLASITFLEFEELLRSGTYDGREIIPVPGLINVTELFSIESWGRLCRDMPDYAVKFWLYPFGLYENFDGDEEDSYSEFVAKIIIEKPWVAVNDILGIGKIIKRQPKYEAAIKRAISTLETAPLDDFGQGETYPFDLEIDQYPRILVVFARAITMSHTAHVYRRRSGYLWNSEGTYNFGSFGLELNMLRSIYEDGSKDCFIRAAALVCRIMLHEKEFTKETFFAEGLDSISLELVSLGFQKSIAIAITKVFKNSPSTLAYEEERYLGSFILAIKDNYQALQAIQSLIYRLREQSKAPIQSNGVLEKWLAEEATG